MLRIDEPGEGVARLVLDRPEKKNALSIELRDEISEALDRLADNETLKVVIITGAGDVFSAGFDLKEFDAALADQVFATKMWASSDRYHRTCVEFPLPTIAAVNGPAIAGGFDLAVMCDLRVASETARFAHPEIAFGDVVYGPLHDLVGGALARELCFTGRAIDAAEALAVNLVSTVVARDELDSAALATATAIARAPRDVLLRTKAKVLRHAGVHRGGTLDL